MSETLSFLAPEMSRVYSLQLFDKQWQAGQSLCLGKGSKTPVTENAEKKSVEIWPKNSVF